MEEASTHTPVVSPSGRDSAYADVVRAALKKAPAPLSAKELRDLLGLSERLVRDGIERLISDGEVAVSRRVTPHKRGAPPLVYAVKP